MEMRRETGLVDGSEQAGALCRHGPAHALEQFHGCAAGCTVAVRADPRRLTESANPTEERSRPTAIGRIKGARCGMVGRMKKRNRSITSRKVDSGPAPRRFAQPTGRSKQRAPCLPWHGALQGQVLAQRRVYFGHSVQAKRRGTLRLWLAICATSVLISRSLL
jgi:hypothetical protein